MTTICSSQNDRLRYNDWRSVMTEVDMLQRACDYAAADGHYAKSELRNETLAYIHAMRAVEMNCMYQCENLEVIGNIFTGDPKLVYALPALARAMPSCRNYYPLYVMYALIFQYLGFPSEEVHWIMAAATPLDPEAVNEQYYSQVEIEMPKQPSADREAYFTLVNDENFVEGALALGCSLRKAKVTRPYIALITDDISHEARDSMKRMGWQLRVVDLVRQNTHEAKYKMYTKWDVFKQVDFRKGVYLDADTLVLKNIDHMFNFKAFSARRVYGLLFNAGVFVFEPSLDTYDALHHRLSTGNYSRLESDPTDQDILVTHFSLSGALYSFPPQYNHKVLDHVEMRRVFIRHYVGNPKPWGVVGYAQNWTPENLNDPSMVHDVQEWHRIRHSCDI